MKSFAILSIFIAAYHVVVAIHVDVIEQQSQDYDRLEMTQITADATQYSFDASIDFPLMGGALKTEDGQLLQRLSTNLCNAKDDNEECVARIMANDITDKCSLEKGDYTLSTSYDVDIEACNTFLDINGGDPIRMELKVYTYDYNPVATMKYQISG